MNDETLVELPEARVLRLQPGDVVVFTVDDVAAFDQTMGMEERISALLPTGVTAMVVHGMTVTGISR